MQDNLEAHLYERIYAAVRQIPHGKVASYGQIARIVGGCSAQMVGFALAALPNGSDVPWQRVINVQGKISPHGYGFGSAVQRDLLLSEGVEFGLEDRIDFERFGWLSD
jgi:methylated-DNA-protein-cysteine methyltransferase-like protein